MKRSTRYTTAAILQALLSLFDIAGALVFLPRGADALNQGGDSPPYVVLMLALIVGVLGLVSAWAVWKYKRWGVILTIVLRVVDGLAALPGILVAPTPFLMVAVCRRRDRQRCGDRFVALAPVARTAGHSLSYG